MPSFMLSKYWVPTKAAISGSSSRHDGQESNVKSEAIKYSVGSLGCRGELIYDEAAERLPLLLMAPNWLGVTVGNIAVGRMLAAQGYVVFVPDMFGEGKGPTGS